MLMNASALSRLRSVRVGKSFAKRKLIYSFESFVFDRSDSLAPIESKAEIATKTHKSLAHTIANESIESNALGFALFRSVRFLLWISSNERTQRDKMISVRTFYVCFKVFVLR